MDVGDEVREGQLPAVLEAAEMEQDLAETNAEIQNIAARYDYALQGAILAYQT